MDYMEAMVKNVLCRGLEDSEIQMDLLGGKSQDMKLERVLRFVEAKESGKRSAFCLLLPQSTDYVAGSSYRKQKKVVPEDQETYITVGPRGTDGTHQQGLREQSALLMAASTNLAIGTTTLKK